MMAIHQMIEATISYEGVISFPLAMTDLVTKFIPCGCVHEQSGRVTEFCLPCSPLRLSNETRDRELFWARVFGPTSADGLCATVRDRVFYLACGHRLTVVDYFKYPYVYWACAACTATRAKNRKRARGE